jgi:hypothetical protein
LHNGSYKRSSGIGALTFQFIPDFKFNSSGENYAFLERQGLKSFIPPHGTFKGGPDGFIYIEDGDYYCCPQGKTIPFTKEFLDSRTQTRKKEYRARKHVCIDCPIRSSCLAKSAQEKKFSVTYYRAEYQRNIARVNSPQGRYMKGKRQSTVEPVFGTLTQFMGLGKVNTLGLAQANKCMHLSAMAYNIKKYLKFIQKRTKSGAESLVFTFSPKRWFHQCIIPFLRHPNIAHL